MCDADGPLSLTTSGVPISQAKSTDNSVRQLTETYIHFVARGRVAFRVHALVKPSFPVRWLRRLH